MTATIVALQVRIFFGNFWKLRPKVAVFI